MRAHALVVAALVAIGAAPAPTATAVFAGGCFWSTENAMDKVPGVVSTTSGFSGGTVANPSYEQVSGGRTGHLEAVRVTYDPRRISYAALADAFLRTIDPSDAGGTFCDRGEEYKTAMFVANEGERQAALAARARAMTAPSLRGKSAATRVLAVAPFYAAEDYHQDYARLNPLRYRAYRVGCGRDAALARVWGNPAA